MKAVFFTLVLFLFFFISCTSEKPDIYRTKSGNYASLHGGFSTSFPVKPDISVANVKGNSGTYVVHMFRTAVGTNKKFRVTYIDYPKNKITDLNKEQIYTEEVHAIIKAIGGNLTLDSFFDINENSISGKYFTINRTPPITLGDNFIEGKIFLKNNRVYIITHSGPISDESLLFMSSFRFIN